ncbi:MAG: hypothetical protein MUC96_33035 [Myxococcaceae bacterium]|jgi:hypothetical protein|nr:hypothetical protein [Myxococcaceae bacterium]
MTTFVLIAALTGQVPSLVPSATEGRTARIFLAPDDAPASTSTSGFSLSKKPVGLTLSAISLLALGVGGGLGVNASDLARQANESTSEYFFKRLGAEAQGNATAANVAFGLAAAALVGAIIAFIVEG